MGRCFLAMRGAFAQFESDLTGERVRLVKDRKLERAEYGGGTAPLGWRVAKKRGPGGKKMLEPIPEEIEIVELIHDLHDQGHSYQQIADELKERGYRTRQGSLEWSRKTLWGVLRRRGGARAGPRA